MNVHATKPFKQVLKQRGRKRIRWQVKFFARDATGNLKQIARKTFTSKTEAIDETPRLVDEYSKTQGNIVTGSKMTFGDLVAIAENTFYANATLHNGLKVAGVKSYKSKQSELKRLKGFFGDFKISNIRQAEIAEYKKRRLKYGSQRGKSEAPLAMGTLNHELKTLKRLLNYALSEGWIIRSPFASKAGAMLIDGKAELARARILTKDEEALLLVCCEPGKKQISYVRKRKSRDKKAGESQEIKATVETGNFEMRAIILLALDSGLRRQEILKLAWRDLDLNEATATILAANTKTERTREVFLTQRTIDALLLLPTYKRKPNVFNSLDIKRCWNTTRRLAGIADVRLHDLRATAATRMIEQHIPLEIVGKLLGDRNLVDVVYKHYIRINRPMIQDVRAQMDAYNAQGPVHNVDVKQEYTN